MIRAARGESPAAFDRRCIPAVCASRRPARPCPGYIQITWGCTLVALWLLMAPGQPRLEIPLTAKGADQLFDAFATLPGIRTEHMLRQMQERAAHQVVIWRAPSVRDAARRLH